jgi:hypothetical protein
MASRTYEGTSSPKTSTATAANDDGPSSGIGATVADAAGTVRVAAGDAVAKLPEVAATTRSAIEDANRQMRAGSDEMLTIGTVLSFGFAMGLLIGGASRLLVAGALIPAAMMSFTLLDRTSRTRSSAHRLQDA